ncbi:hypothetical protein ASE82_18245 [Sphingomonas sp. Leaf230]|nr:hypothetical protein ASE82_18245 [Sphingomonas sp. Leaf230]
MGESAQLHSISVRTKVIGKSQRAVTTAREPESTLHTVARQLLDQSARHERPQMIIETIGRSPELIRQARDTGLATERGKRINHLLSHTGAEEPHLRRIADYPRVITFIHWHRLVLKYATYIST